MKDADTWRARISGASAMTARNAQPDAWNEQRDKLLLDTAVTLALANGWRAVTRLAVAQAAGVAAGTVSNYRRGRQTNVDDRTASGMKLLGEDVMRWAAEHGALVVLRDGVAARHPIALAADEQLRVAAMMED